MLLDAHDNVKFSRDIAAERLQKLMIEFVNLTSRADFSFSARDIDQIDLASKAFSEISAQYSSMLKEFAQERRANLEKYQDVELISLGEDCFCRTLLTQWGLKKGAKLGEKSVPFDLSVHPLGVLERLLVRDFQGYMDPANLRYSEDGKICSNAEYRVTFNHEIGEKYAENDFLELREVYKRRIQRFYDLMNSDKLLILALHVGVPWADSNALAVRVFDVLKQRWPEANLRMFVVNTFAAGAPLPEAQESASPHACFIDVNYPVPNYRWHVPDYCFSPEGYAFEKALISRIKTTLDMWIDEPLMAPVPQLSAALAVSA